MSLYPLSVFSNVERGGARARVCVCVCVYVCVCVSVCVRASVHEISQHLYCAHA